MINQILHSHWLLLSLVITPIVIALVKNKKNKFYYFSVSFLATYLAGAVIKEATAINRPFINNPELLQLTANIPQTYSFPSLHTALITVFAWAISTIAPKLSWLGFLVAFIISISRVYLGVHYYFDIVGGFLLGTFIFWLSYCLFNPEKIFPSGTNPNVRRKIAHLIYGLVLAFLIYHQVLFPSHLGLLALALGIYVVISHFKKENTICQIISYFERHPDPKYYGIGPLFFLISGFLTTLFFKNNIAVAALINLTIGDSVNALVGHFSFEPLTLGKKSTNSFYGKKKIQPAIAAAIAATTINLYFVSPTQAVIGALVTFLLEFSSPKISGTEIDDNLLIPITSALAMSLF